eukprot:GHVR01142730.1.p2 GENE.GHVR01142730.1~~GHVR01142730.1.p2  ORF type:complete len:100 (+),score=42.25 GHVR01142730.1:379-678(+)
MCSNTHICAVTHTHHRSPSTCAVTHTHTHTHAYHRSPSTCLISPSSSIVLLFSCGILLLYVYGVCVLIRGSSRLLSCRLLSHTYVNLPTPTDNKYTLSP